MNSSRRWWCVLAAVAGLLVMDAVAQSKEITVCLLPKKKGLPYFTTCAQGAAEAAKELGHVKLIYDGPSDGAPEKAASMIEKWTLQGVDVIAVSPNDPEVLAPAMKKAREKGVHVITWDADGAPGTREFFVNQATAQDIGYALVDTMAKDLGGENATGEVAIITATLTAANQNAWIKHMKERLLKYPKLTLVSIQPSNEDQKLAFQAAQDLMKAHPQLRGIFAISSVAFPGAAEAVKQAGAAGKVLVTGLSTPNDMRSYVMDGTVKSVILWNTIDLGYLTVRVADALASGALKPGNTTLDAGRLGPKQIVGDNVLLGAILVFTKENIGRYNF
jgi:rhamnose transport system substrate-binding protein